MPASIRLWGNDFPVNIVRECVVVEEPSLPGGPSRKEEAR